MTGAATLGHPDVPRPGITLTQELILRFIEAEVAAGRASPNTVAIQKAGIVSSLGQIARCLDAIEQAGYITRRYGKKNNIRLSTPALKHASTEQLIDELRSRGSEPPHGNAGVSA